MKFLVADTCYPDFLRSFHAAMPAGRYVETRDALLARSFGTADFYSINLRALGHEAQEVVCNDAVLQRRWAKEQGTRVRARAGTKAELLEIFEAQVDAIRPDVLYVQDVPWVDAALLRRIRPRVRTILGQMNYPLPLGLDVGPYDLVFSGVKQFVDMCRRRDVRAELLRIAFEPDVLRRMGPVERRWDAVFVGGFAGPQHAPGASLLADVAKRVPVEFWGYGADALPLDSPIRARFHGEAWGLDMYRVLAGARIAINRHGPVAGRGAANMRLYEATGVGTCLVTDAKDDLAELFTPEREVLTYRSAEECAERVTWLLSHEAERAAIAAAGQARTKASHTYRHRMEEVVFHVHALVAGARSTDKPRGLAPAAPATPDSTVRRVAGRVLARLRGPDRWTSTSVKPDSVGGNGAADASLVAAYQGLPEPELRAIADAIEKTGPGGSIVELGMPPGGSEEALSVVLGRSLKYECVELGAASAALGDHSADIVILKSLESDDRDARAVAEAARLARTLVLIPVASGAPRWIFRGSDVRRVHDPAVLAAAIAAHGLSIDATIALDRLDTDAGPLETVLHVCRPAPPA